MDNLRNYLVRDMLDAVQVACNDHAAINQAARDSINDPNDGGVYDYVYNAYTPTFYQRRYDNGGLADDRNLVTTHVVRGNDSVTMTFEDRTRENAGGSWITPDPAYYVSDLVEAGSYGNKWPFSQIWYSQQARPYLDNSLVDGSQNGQIIDSAIEDTVRNLRIGW